MIVNLSMNHPDFGNFRKTIIGIGLLGLLFAAPEVKAQTKETAIKMDQSWSYISGPQRLVNEANRVNYLIGPEHSLGTRVNNFSDLKPMDAHDSDFLRFHLNADQVFDMNKTTTGPDFYIGKTEVSNTQYREFIRDCIRQWMKENKPEVVKNYKDDSPKYIKAVHEWLRYDVKERFYRDTLRNYTWAELEMKMEYLDYSRITWKGTAVYPNINAWLADFQYSYNEPMTRFYFNHPKYANYPVVGISQVQATLFCEWYTHHKANGFIYRIPTEQEWERAASVIAKKPSKKSSGSPVNNNYLRNSKGVYIANYHTAIGDFTRDGALYPATAESYFPNDAGCYNMQGNVAEWTSNVIQIGNESSAVTGYIIKGGAWNLPAAACTIGSRTILPEGLSTSYVGFRLVAVPMRKYKPTGTPEF